MKRTKKQYEKIIDAVKARLAESQEKGEGYFHKVMGEQFIVMPGVFSPKHFESPSFFAESILGPLLKQYNHLGDFLEIGTGTGAIACLIAKSLKSYRIVATDIDARAVRNAKINVLYHELEKKVEVLEGDIYKPVKGKKFNMIFWNIPFADWGEKGALDGLENAVFDPRGRNLAQYILGAEYMLHPSGALLLGYSPTVGNPETLETLCYQADMRTEIIAETTLKHGTPRMKIDVQLLELRKDK